MAQLLDLLRIMYAAWGQLCLKQLCEKVLAAGILPEEALEIRKEYGQRLYFTHRVRAYVAYMTERKELVRTGRRGCYEWNEDEKTNPLYGIY